MKHAFLILAHNEFGLLQTLVNCLDDPRNDIFVHIDKKVEQLPDIRTVKAGLELIPDRKDIRWGDFSMVEAEYALFRAAGAKGPYAFYHLLSGVDLPLRSQDRIHAFFDAHPDRQFVGYTLTQMTPELVRRMQRRHMFPREFSRKKNIYSYPRALYLLIQEKLGIKRNKDIEFKQGSQWVSVTEDFVKYLLKKEKWARKTFSHTFVPDECLFQTLCWDSPFRSQLYRTDDDGMGCMRNIGWRGSQLKDWSEEDFDYLESSLALFARKFNSSDPAFIARIIELSKR